MGDEAPRAPASADDYSDTHALFEQIDRLDSDDPARDELRTQIVTRTLPLAEHIAVRFRGRGEAHDDLLQVARMGLVGAVNRFDVRRGSDFVSFAVPTIMGEVRKHFRDTGWALRVPRRMQELHALVGDAVGRLSQRLGRAPTAEEIAAEVGLSRAEVVEGLLAGAAYHPRSIDAPVDDSSEATLADTLGEEDSAIDRAEALADIRPIIAELPARERRILSLRFFESMTQTQIAEQIGVSQMQVSRILSRTLDEIRAQFEAGG